MKLRKTPKSERTTYTYYFDNGDKIILEPGKQTTIRASGYVSVKVDDSITELAIAQMHKDDDKEVESNLNYINCETRADAEKRRKLKKEWDEDHRDEFGFVHGENPYEKRPTMPLIAFACSLFLFTIAIISVVVAAV